MALTELVFFKQPEEEEEEDTKARNNLMPLLGLVGPIFKPDPNACPIFQVIITIIFAICIQAIVKNEFCAILIANYSIGMKLLYEVYRLI